MTLTDAQETLNGLNTWPGRFNVRAEVRYRGRRGTSGVMQVMLYQPDLTEDECAAILAQAGFTPGDQEWLSLVSQSRDTFSLEQAEALTAYLKSREGTTAKWVAAKLPMPGRMGASVIPTLPSFRDGFVYRYGNERGYNLPFKVEAVNVKTYLHLAHLYNEFRSNLI